MVCDVAEDLVEKLRKFRFRKETNNAAIISKPSGSLKAGISVFFFFLYSCIEYPVPSQSNVTSTC